MEKYMSLDDIKRMTKRKFQIFLASKGLIVLDYPGEYRLLVPCIDEETFQDICQSYGASGNYFPERKLGIISNWGYNDSIYEFRSKTEKQDSNKVLKEIRWHYNASIRKCGNLEIITIFGIPEKKFRKLLIKYNCWCITYKSKIHIGKIIL